MEKNSAESSKRFSLSKETFARERIKAVKSALEEMKLEYPETIGLTLFGSLVKGTAREESDIDALLLIDPDKINNDQPGEPTTVFRRYDHHQIRGGERYESAYYWPDFRKDIEEKYEKIFKTKIINHALSIREPQLKDVLVEPLNVALIDQMMNEIITSYRKYPEGVTFNTFRFAQNIEEGENAADIPEEIRVEPNQLLYMLFHLELGGGVPRYRKLIIDRLIAEGEVGEKIWNSLISATESWEQRTAYDSLPTAKRYPRTLSEAARVYGQ